MQMETKAASDVISEKFNNGEESNDSIQEEKERSIYINQLLRPTDKDGVVTWPSLPKNPFKDKQIAHLDGNAELPILEICTDRTTVTTLSPAQKLAILDTDVIDEAIVEKMPFQVLANCTFVINLNRVRSDWKIMDTGSFRHNGVSSKVFCVRDGKYKSWGRRKNHNQGLVQNETLLRTSYFKHSNPSHSNYTRQITEVFKGMDLKRQPYVLLQFSGYSGILVPSPKRQYNKKIKKEDSPLQTSPKKRKRDDELSNVMDLCNETKDVSFSINPHPRVVYASTELMKSVVTYCTGLGKHPLFCVEPVYNMGDFYLTTTTYQLPALINEKTGKPVYMPGPAMFHIAQERADFLHFAFSLIERDEEFQNLNFVAGDFSIPQQGFLLPLKRSTFLPCAEQLKQEIIQFLIVNELAVLQAEVISDIFGNEDRRIKGLVDCFDQEEYRENIHKYEMKWGELEESNKGVNSNLFVAYFKTYINDIIEQGMLRKLRKFVGLGDKPFVNSLQMNREKNMTSEVKEKESNKSGYCPQPYSTWSEAIQHYHEYVTQEHYKTHLAVIGKGPYRFSPEFSHLNVPEVEWCSKTTEEQRQHLEMFSTFSAL